MKSAVIFLCIIFTGNNFTFGALMTKLPESIQPISTAKFQCILNGKFQEDPDLKRCNKNDRIDIFDKALCEIFVDVEKRLCSLLNDETKKTVESMLNSALKDTKYQTKKSLCSEFQSLYVNKQQHNATLLEKEESCMKMCTGANLEVDKLCIYIYSLNKAVQKYDVLNTSTIGNDSLKSVPATVISNRNTLTENIVEVSKKLTAEQPKLVENNGPLAVDSTPVAQKQPEVIAAVPFKTKEPTVAAVEKIKKLEKVAAVENVEKLEKAVAVEKEAAASPQPSRPATEQSKAPEVTSSRQPALEYEEDPGDDQESFPPTERGGGGGGGGGVASALPADRLGPDAMLEPDESNFFSYFMLVSVLCIIGYVLYHNKQKVFALLLEGRKERGARRRPNTAGYRKLNSNLEEAVTSKCSGSAAHVIY